MREIKFNEPNLSFVKLNQSLNVNSPVIKGNIISNLNMNDDRVTNSEILPPTPTTPKQVAQITPTVIWDKAPKTSPARPNIIKEFIRTNSLPTIPEESTQKLRVVNTFDTNGRLKIIKINDKDIIKRLQNQNEKLLAENIRTKNILNKLKTILKDKKLRDSFGIFMDQCQINNISFPTA